MAKLAKDHVGYYERHVKARGVWFGSGAKELRLGKVVEDSQLLPLLKGFHPKTGRALVLNAGHEKRQGAWDLTFSAPKSVSVLWSQLSGKERAFIEKAHDTAVQRTLQVLENVAGFTRRGKEGQWIERARLTFALFDDYTSRALDPQLHTHALLLNVSVRKDGTTGSVRSKNIFETKIALGTIYRLTLAKTIAEYHAFQMESDKVGFRLTDVPQQLCAALSNRRAQIKAGLDRLGKTDAISAKKIALRTRENPKAAKMEALFTEWQRIGARHSLGPNEAKMLFDRTLGPDAEAKAEDTIEAIVKGLEKTGRYTRDELNVWIKKAEWQAFAPWRGVVHIASLVELITSHFVHVRTHTFPFPFGQKPRGANAKRTASIRYLAQGPRVQRWGFVKFRPVVCRYGEFRIQQRILFPRVPLVKAYFDYHLYAFRWYGYNEEEKAKYKSLRKAQAKREKEEQLQRATKKREEEKTQEEEKKRLQESKNSRSL